MHYERPRILRRDSIAGMLTAAPPSDVKPDGVESDVHIKDNIVPVAWTAQPSGYARPAIVRRDPIAGLLDSKQPSDVKPDTAPSDVHIKDHIVPVRW